MNTVLKIPGMMCHHCEKTIKGALENMDGVKSVVIDLTAKTAAVEYEAPADPAAMTAVLGDIGYDVE